MTNQEKRHEIYKFIEENIGKIEPNVKIPLAQLLVEYTKVHNESLVKKINLIDKKLEEGNKLRKKKKYKESREVKEEVKEEINKIKKVLPNKSYLGNY